MSPFRSGIVIDVHNTLLESIFQGIVDKRGGVKALVLGTQRILSIATLGLQLTMLGLGVYLYLVLARCWRLSNETTTSNKEFLDPLSSKN